jgi:hypothetical protein
MRRGDDGNTWIITMDKNRKRWSKYKTFKNSPKNSTKETSSRLSQKSRSKSRTNSRKPSKRPSSLSRSKSHTNSRKTSRSKSDAGTIERMAEESDKYVIHISYYVAPFVADNSLNQIMKSFESLEWYGSDLTPFNKYGRVRIYKYKGATLDVLRRLYSRIKGTRMFISLLGKNNSEDQTIFNIFAKKERKMELTKQENDLIEKLKKVYMAVATKEKDALKKVHPMNRSYYEKEIKNLRYLDTLPKNSNSFVKHSQVKTEKMYVVHDNGGRPFKVVVDKTGIGIYGMTYDEYISDSRNRNYSVLIKKIGKYQGYWYGYDTSQERAHGNSILIQVTGKEYINVGWNVYSFTTDDEIIDYVSPLGNNDVPYPVAYGTKNTYFMLDMKYILNDELELERTLQNASYLYNEFYGHIGRRGKANNSPSKRYYMDPYKKIEMKGLKIIHTQINKTHTPIQKYEGLINLTSTPPLHPKIRGSRNSNNVVHFNSKI